MKSFVLPNRIGFLPWFYTNFEDGDSQLFRHQRLVQQFMQPSYPYRGLLLYHGLGQGKSCSSIAIANEHLELHRRVVLLIPASLVTNYKQEIENCIEVGLTKRPWYRVTVIDPDEFQRTFPYLPTGPFSTPHIRLLQPMKEQGIVQIERITPTKKLIADYIKERYTIINFNGIRLEVVKKDPARFDGALIIMDEAHNFISRVVHRSTIAKALYKQMMDAKDAKIVLLSGTPMINHPFELTYLINLLRGPIHSYEIQLKAKAVIPSMEDIGASLHGSPYWQYVDSYHIDVATRRIHIQLLPSGFIWETEDHDRIIQRGWELDDEAVMKGIHAAFAAFKKLDKINSYALPIEPERFDDLFVDQRDPDQPRVQNSDLFMRRIIGTISYFKPAISPLLPELTSSDIVRVPMSDHQFKHYLSIRQKERKMERSGNQSALSSKGRVFKAFSRMACNFVFPDDIHRPFPTDLRREIDLAEQEDDTDTLGPRAPSYDERLEKALQKVREGADMYLLRDLYEYSPKFKQVFEILESSVGTSLLYSQFRTVEGIGLFAEVLKAHGWCPLQLEKSKGLGWRIDSSSFQSPKRFITYSDDREKNEIFLNLFNSQWDSLPDSIQAQLKEQGISTNLHGELCRLLMITQSGSEGLSLRNVRTVHIMEPYWNKIRMDQVIGRAIRTCSHMMLPPAERNVRVYTYVLTFTAKQLQQSFTIRTQDKGRTSDEQILLLALQKDLITTRFLELMQQASIDCVLHAKENMPSRCYSFPINAEPMALSYTAKIEADDPDYITHRREKTEKLQGREHITDDNTLVIVDPNTGAVYDHHAFKYGRVAIPKSS